MIKIFTCFLPPLHNFQVLIPRSKEYPYDCCQSSQPLTVAHCHVEEILTWHGRNHAKDNNSTHLLWSHHIFGKRPCIPGSSFCSLKRSQSAFYSLFSFSLTMTRSTLHSWAPILLVLCSTSSSTLVLVSGFTNAIFQESVTAQRTAPSKIEGVEIELPNFDELFERVQQVSPLARVAMEQKQQQTEKRGFEAAAQYDSTYYKRLSLLLSVFHTFTCSQAYTLFSV